MRNVDKSTEPIYKKLQWKLVISGINFYLNYYGFEIMET